MLEKIKIAMKEYYKDGSHGMNPAYIDKCQSMLALHNMLLKWSGDDSEHMLHLYFEILAELAEDKEV